MFRKIMTAVCGILVGGVFAYGMFVYNKTDTNVPASPKRQVIGFLPYWLIEKAKSDYSSYITTLTYFGVSIGSDGKLVKLANEQEEEPGWHALHLGKLDKLFSAAKQKNVSLSLLVFSGDADAINTMVENSTQSAQNLLTDVLPIMKQYGFTDLNLDIENVHEASQEAQLQFVQFVKTVKRGLQKEKAGTLTLEITGDSLIKKNVIDVARIAALVDSVVLMAYDFHYQGSFVVGPVAPLAGAGTVLEYDTQTAIAKALAVIPKEKLILGIPLYGYEWETMSNSPHAAAIPGTGIVASNKRLEQLLADCATCSAWMDSLTQEAHAIYFDQDSETYHNIAYPNEEATKSKIDFAKKQNLGGIAVWALGYEGSTILNPLRGYK